MSTLRDFTCHLVLHQHLTEGGKDPGKMEWQSKSQRWTAGPGWTHAAGESALARPKVPFSMGFHL